METTWPVGALMRASTRSIARIEAGPGPGPIEVRRAGQPGDSRAKQRDAGFRDRLVAADMVRTRAGVDHVTDRRWCDLLDRGEHGAGVRRRTGVDDDHTVLADLHRDIRATAGNHVEGWPKLQNLDLRGGGRWRSLRDEGGDEREDDGGDGN